MHRVNKVKKYWTPSANGKKRVYCNVDFKRYLVYCLFYEFKTRTLRSLTQINIYLTVEQNGMRIVADLHFNSNKSLINSPLCRHSSILPSDVT